MQERFKIFTGTAIILKKNSSYLLHKRQNTNWMDNYYALIGERIKISIF